MAKGFLILPIIVILALIITGAVFAFKFKQTMKFKLDVAGAQTIVKTVPTPKPIPVWKTYKNEDYNFQLTYPGKGVILEKEALEVGECGTSIKADKEGILVDNFYKLKAISWNGSLEEYLKSQGALNAYEVESIKDSGADEAVQLLRLKKGFEVAIGYPPLLYVKAVFKKGDKTFLMQQIIHNPSNIGGCIQPTVVDPTKFPEIAKQNWDITTSLKFF